MPPAFRVQRMQSTQFLEGAPVADQPDPPPFRIRKLPAEEPSRRPPTPTPATPTRRKRKPPEPPARTPDPPVRQPEPTAPVVPQELLGVRCIGAGAALTLVEAAAGVGWLTDRAQIAECRRQPRAAG